MKKNYYLKIISSLIIGVLFLFIAFGSGADKPKWEKNSKEIICGKEFEDSHNQENIGLDIKTVTIFNCNGTYTSKEDYDSDNLGIRGNSNNFHGTWEIATNNIPSEIANKTIGLVNDKYTIIKYKSNNGKVRYATILNLDDGYVYLSLIVLDNEIPSSDGYEAKDYDMFEGRMVL
jgi:hypothetical protein